MVGVEPWQMMPLQRKTSKNIPYHEPVILPIELVIVSNMVEENTIRNRQLIARWTFEKAAVDMCMNHGRVEACENINIADQKQHSCPKKAMPRQILC